MFPTEPVPERIGAYQVVRRLASSGPVDVYVGRMDGPLGFQRTVALKIVRFSIEDDARMAEELEREASICAQLNHPGVLRMFDFFQHERRLVLVMDHVDGASLDRLQHHLARRKKKLDDKPIFYIGSQIVAALAHAHATTDEDGNLTPVIHRNLSPENVLISWDGHVRLTGFGLGKILGRTPDTVVGTIKGTPGYMAPEQARGERVTPRADVYGFGMLMWTLLSGRPPPPNGEAPAPLSSLRKDIPREISAAVEAALEPSPDKRKISCEEIAQWLNKVVRAESARKELRDKVLLLRSTRTPVGETQDGAKAPRQGKQQRRRLHLRGVKASMRPGGPGPLSQPVPPSSRPGIRRSSSAPGQGLTPSQMPDLAMRPPPSFRDSYPFDSTHPASSRPSSIAARRRGPMGTQVMQVPSSIPISDSTAPEPNGASAPPTLKPSARPPETSDVVESARPPAETSPPSAPPGPHSTYGPPSPPQPRSLSVFESIAVAALTAGVIVGAGMLVVEYGRADEATPTSTPPPPTATQVVAPIDPDPSAEPTAASAAPEPAPTSEPSPEPLDGTSLPGGKAYLTVHSRVSADVYLNGRRFGPAGEPLVVDCGRWFLRLGTESPGNLFPDWIGPGQTLYVRCQDATEVDVQPKPPPGRE